MLVLKNRDYNLLQFYPRSFKKKEREENLDMDLMNCFKFKRLDWGEGRRKGEFYRSRNRLDITKVFFSLRKFPIHFLW